MLAIDYDALNSRAPRERMSPMARRAAISSTREEDKRVPGRRVRPTALEVKIHGLISVTAYPIV